MNRAAGAEELKMLFISPIFRIANVNERGKLRTFFERSLSGKVNNIQISVVVDCMIATPTKASRPASPYFFLQDGPSLRYKRTEGDTHDRSVGPAEGQMLTAMILAQDMNADGYPLYGC